MNLSYNDVYLLTCVGAVVRDLGHHWLHSRMNGGRGTHLVSGIETQESGYIAVEVVRQQVVMEILVGIPGNIPCLHRV